MDSSDFDIALKMFLNDITGIEANQKGKERDDEQSDDKLAIQCMKEQLLSIQAAKDDRTIALSTLRAVTTDGNAISSIRHDEWIAKRDHRYALGLERGEIPETNSLYTIKHLRHVDSISLAIGYLSHRMKAADLEDSGKDPSLIGIRQTKMKCTSCLDERDDIAFSGRCGHKYCQECTRRLILSTRCEALYPPRCFGQVISPMVILSVLSYEELRSFSDKVVEYNTKNRVYCADPRCSEFIPHLDVASGNATCPRCSKITHLQCRALAHPGVGCPVNNERYEVLEMANTEKWRQCSRCKNMVELLLGCNHITCICGHQFCYVCGLVWNTCDCALWDERRLVARVNEEMEDEVAPGADEKVRRRAFNEIYHQLQGHEGVPCEHHRHSQWTYYEKGKMKCEFCGSRHHHYIFRCKNCRLRACYGCRMHRL